jgi:hypothetical protein
MRGRFLVLSVVLLAACGSRTPLIVDETPEPDAGAPDASPPIVDATAPDVFVADCAQPGASLIYLVSDGAPIELYSVDPADGAFTDIGTLDCPTSDVPKAFSIAVDRRGSAYVLTSDFGMPAQGALWQVSTATAHCEPVQAYARGQFGFSVFGMAFATDGHGPDETLYIEGAADLGSVAAFGRLDTSTWKVTYVGANEPPIQRGQLTGTADGQIFEIYYTTPGTPGYLPFDEVDTSTGRISSMTNDGSMYFGSAFSVAQSGGTAFLFAVVPGVGTTVLSVPSMPSLPFTIPNGITIAAAGVSTCAPP